PSGPDEDEAVRVGERDDTLPPEYRPKPGEISKLPAPKPQPSLDDTEALDILSGDFSSSCAPSTKTAPSAQPTAPPAESLSALDCLSQDFVSPSKGAAVQALSRRSSGVDVYVVFQEATVEEDKAVRVGERDDTLPPEYRPKPGEISKLPAPKPQPSLDDTEALDILSGDFSSSCAPSTQV
uniref:Calpastatin n=1 Tax=Neogobius melanostomus TaxID=47308 RepID=A0A8C6UDT9_9GOBI